MTTWDGWDAQLLAALAVTDTGTNRLFLDQWAKADGTTCAHNPLAATVPLSGSTHCQHISGHVYVQAYSTRAHGIAATAKQLEEHPYAAIIDALKTGEPFTYANWQEVVGALGVWGAHKFAVKYANEAQQAGAGGSSGPPGTVDVPRSLAGYKHLSQTLAHHVPQQLRSGQQLRRAALARLRG